MRIAVVGLGAVGGLVAAALGGADDTADRVSALARGPTLRAVQRDGVRVVDRRRPDAPDRVVRLRVSDDPAALGRQDVIVLAVKATSLAALAPTLSPMLGADTVVVPAMNGVPWWFFHGLDETLAARRWRSIDPDGTIARALPARHVLGCVVHLACSAPRPGVVERASGNALIVGEPSGGTSERVDRLAGCLARAGFDASVSPRIQHDVWFKLWGNMTVNPISALTGATTDRLLDDPLVRAFVTATMREAAAVGERIGLPIDTAPEQRHEVTRRLGSFRTSMLQDLEAGRPLELDALVAIVAEIARAVGVDTPNVDALLGLARLHARVRGLYPEKASFDDPPRQ